MTRREDTFAGRYWLDHAGYLAGGAVPPGPITVHMGIDAAVLAANSIARILHHLQLNADERAALDALVVTLFSGVQQASCAQYRLNTDEVEESAAIASRWDA